MKTVTDNTYTPDGNLLSKKETASLSWRFLHDENGNVVNANFGVGNITNKFDQR